jgi:hypothetical protein
MIIPPERALEGVVDTLEKVIIPELSSLYAKGQAVAAISLLQGLSMRLGRVERLYRAENERLRAILQLFGAKASHFPKARREIGALMRHIRKSSQTPARSSAYDDLRRENIELRSRLNELLVILDSNRSSREAAKLRRRVQRHIKQILQELRLGVESRMREVSKG